MPSKIRAKKDAKRIAENLRNFKPTFSKFSGVLMTLRLDYWFNPRNNRSIWAENGHFYSRINGWLANDCLSIEEVIEIIWSNRKVINRTGLFGKRCVG